MSAIDMLGDVGDFEMPSLCIGTEVEVSTDPALTRPDWGVVIGVHKQSADIWFQGTGVGYVRRGFLEDCWYEGDPRIRTNPGIINAEERRGVFRLSKREQTMRSLDARMQSMEDALEGVCKRLASAEKALNQAAK